MRKKIITTVKSQLSQGTAPEQLSLGLTLGILFGVLPFPGVTTALLALLVSLFRLNMTVTQITNYAAHPLQLVLYIPFLKFRKFLGKLHGVSVHDVYHAIKENVLLGIQHLWVIHLWAVLAWMIVSIPTGFLIYHILLLQLQNYRNRQVHNL